MKDDSSARRDQDNPETAAGSETESGDAPEAKQVETESDKKLSDDQDAMQPDSE